MKEKFEVKKEFLREYWKDGGRKVRNYCKYTVEIDDKGTAHFYEKLTFVAVLLGFIPFIIFVILAVIHWLIEKCLQSIKFVANIIGTSFINCVLEGMVNKLVVRKDELSDKLVDMFKENKLE